MAIVVSWKQQVLQDGYISCNRKMIRKMMTDNQRAINRTVLKVLTGAFVCVMLLAGCGRNSVREASGTGTYFDTVIDIRIYDTEADKLLQACFDECARLEDILSAHQESSELFAVNHRTEQTITVSEDLAACIEQGLLYGDLSDGAFDITILPLRELWDFESEDPSVPKQEAIEDALANVDYRKVHLNGTTLTFDDPSTQIDLGGIAKGYISARLKEYLQSQGCTSALINLGGNVSAIGAKPDGSKWVVGIQEPYADRGTVFDTLEIDGGSVISSGTYERYFTVGDVSYHHILDPATGYPVQTDLQQVTVVGDDDVRGDAFSTIGILIGREAAEKLAEQQGWELKLLFIGGERTGEWFTAGKG